mgnify:CR=1 FL=1
MTDIEIAKNTKLDEINKIAEKLEIKEEDIEQYGKYKAKISNEIYEKNKSKNNGKLILVTAISPTPLGEGKTTVSIAIADGLRKIGKKSILTLREPSLGPVFGIKGGATGGGKVQIAPMEDINLHFTGDIHAITSANNLLSAMIDNHIYFGNELEFEKVVWKRCLDLNDRQLRKVETGLSGESKIVPRIDNFDITVASEIMAVLCLAENLKDLKQKLGNIIIGYNKKEEPIYVKQLKAEGAMTVLLKDAIKPNLVQTLEHTPALVHGGPFANIAHGCNSLKATKLAISLSDYVITEAGFGSDLGAEKFFDITCRTGNIKPDCIVLVTTIRSLKYNGSGNIEDGICNLEAHLDNLSVNNSNIVVCLNKFEDDTIEDINYIKEITEKRGISFAVNTSYEDGSAGALSLAREVLNKLQSDNNFKYLYDLNIPIKEKIKMLATNIYHSKSVEYSDIALEKIQELEQKNIDNIPICVSKTQYSLSDDKNMLGYPKDNILHVKDIKLCNGARFITIMLGNILTMPGLPKNPNYEKIDLDQNNNIIGLF